MPHPRCILVIDDDDDVRATLVEVFREEGCRVFEARDGAEGLRVLEGIRPDLVLLDLAMPNVSGWEVLARIRATAGLEDLPVALVTGCASADIPKETFVLKKPLGLAALLHLLDAIEEPASVRSPKVVSAVEIRAAVAQGAKRNHA